MECPLRGDDVNLSNHAVEKCLKLGLPETEVKNRLRKGVGVDYRENVDQDEYETYWPDDGVAAHYVIENTRVGRVTTVLSVFNVTNAKYRYMNGDRFHEL